MQSSPVSALPGVVPAKAQAMDNISASGLPAAEATDDVTFESLLAQQTQAQSAPQSDDPALLIGQQGVAKDQAGKDSSSPQEDASAIFTDLAALFATLVQAAAPMQPSGQTGASTKVGADVVKSDGVGVDAGHNILSLVPGNAFPTGKGAARGSDAKLGKEAAEIAGTGKDLPLVEAKVNPGMARNVIQTDAEERVKAKVNGTAFQFNEPGMARNVIQADAKVDAEVRVEAKVNGTAFQFNEPGMARNVIQADAKVDAEVGVTHTEAFPQITDMQRNENNRAVAVSVEPQVGTPGWDGALGQKVVWLVNQRHQTAEMQLNPPNLGPLEVKITITNDQASALFVSHHAAVRDAIEAALPRLREMLAENGITLGNAQVSAESFPREQTGNGNGRAASGWQPEAHGMEIPDAMGERTGVMRLRTPGSVDVFA